MTVNEMMVALGFASCDKFLKNYLYSALKAVQIEMTNRTPLRVPNKSIEKQNNYNMATIVLNVPDESLVSKIKQACKMLQGVASVKVQRPKSEDITKTAGYKEAMEDIRLGRVSTYESVDQLFEELGIKVKK